MRHRSFFKVLMSGLAVGIALLAQPAAKADSWVVKAGYDLFTTTAGTAFGGVDFMGVPYGTYDFGGSIGTVPTGYTDTIVQRQNDVTVAQTPGNSGTTNLLVVGLQLATTTEVNSFDINGTVLSVPNAYYYATLETARSASEIATLGPGAPSTGSMNITFNDNSGGTITSNMDVWFDLREGSLTGPIVYSGDTGDIGFGSGNWGRTPPTGAQTINGVNVDLLGDGTTNGDFWINTATSMHTGPHGFTTAMVPEPSTWVMLVTAGLIVPVFGRRGRRRA